MRTRSFLVPGGELSVHEMDDAYSRHLATDQDGRVWVKQSYEVPWRTMENRETFDVASFDVCTAVFKTGEMP